MKSGADSRPGLLLSLWVNYVWLPFIQGIYLLSLTPLVLLTLCFIMFFFQESSQLKSHLTISKAIGSVIVFITQTEQFRLSNAADCERVVDRLGLIVWVGGLLSSLLYKMMTGRTLSLGERRRSVFLFLTALAIVALVFSILLVTSVPVEGSRLGMGLMVGFFVVASWLSSVIGFGFFTFIAPFLNPTDPKAEESQCQP